METVLNTFPAAQVQWAYMQNAHGDWVAPNPASIDAAVNAGGDQPLYALTNSVSGAYPLVWTDQMYVRASGLSTEKTEALATIMRYVAVAGQAVMAKHNDGQLSDAQVKEALAAADQVEKGNCKGSDRVLVQNSDPGRYAPNIPEMQGIGKMYHCNPSASAPSSTTTSTTFAPFNPLSSSSFSNNSPINIPLTPLPAVPTATSDATATQTGSQATTKKTTSSRPAALAASKLPVTEPSGSGGTDIKVAMLLGAALYFVLQGPARRLLKVGSE
jgi:hypothetical protein